MEVRYFLSEGQKKFDLSRSSGSKDRGSSSEFSLDKSLAGRSGFRSSSLEQSQHRGGREKSTHRGKIFLRELLVPRSSIFLVDRQ